MLGRVVVTNVPPETSSPFNGLMIFLISKTGKGRIRSGFLDEKGRKERKGSGLVGNYEARGREMETARQAGRQAGSDEVLGCCGAAAERQAGA